MSETQGTEQTEGQAEGQDQNEDQGNTVNVEGDAVVNNAPDGGGVDNNADGAGSGGGAD